MTDKKSLIKEYLPLCMVEYRRIGFTEDDLRYLGSGGELTRERFEAALGELRRVPSGVGAIAYFARYGVDFVALKRDADRAASDGAST